MTFELILENGSHIQATHIGILPLCNISHDSFDLYKVGEKLYLTNEDDLKAVETDYASILDLALDRLQRTPISSDTLYKLITQICIDDLKKEGVEYNNMVISQDPPTNAYIGFATINSLVNRSESSPLLHCFSYIQDHYTDFGCIYLLDDLETILVTRMNYDSECNFDIATILKISEVESSQSKIDTFEMADELKNALSALHVDLSFDLTYSTPSTRII